MSEYGDLYNEMFGQNKEQAKLQTITSLDVNPDDAARAMTLGRDSGVPPSVVLNDLPEFEKQHKGALTSQLLDMSPKLNDYINSHPMAAKVSHDDLGQLDLISKILNEPPKPANPFKIFEKGYEGFKKGIGEGPFLGSWLQKSVESGEIGPAAFAAWSILGAPIEAPAKALTAVGLGGGMAIGEFLSQLTGYEGGAVAGEKIAETLLDPGFQASVLGIHLPSFPKVDPALIRKQAHDVAPFIGAGREPPTGISELIDHLKAEQAKLDLKQLDEALKESVKSQTRERSPDLYEEFARQQDKRRIEISAAAVAELYKDKPPTLDDGILGWVPDLAEQLRAAGEVDGHIEIPIATWLARVDPAIARELHDDIRVRGGLTLNEVKEVKEHHSVESDIEAQRAELYEKQIELFEKAAALEHGDPAAFEAAKKELYAVEAKISSLPRKPMRVTTIPVDISKAGLSEAEISQRRRVAGRHAAFEAYHGSPHTFEAFSMEKIGTGEGAQSYGHGLYFAERPEVAESYAKMSRQGGPISLGTFAGQPVTGLEPLPPTPNRYRVRINAEKEHFLDWDKPLSKQSPHVQQALAQLGDIIHGPAAFRAGRETHYQRKGEVLPELTGEDVVRNLQRHFGGQAEASRALSEVGILGNKYLDQGSRGRAELQKDIETSKSWIEAGKDPTGVHQRNLERFQQELAKPQTHNFVLFDESLIQITHKNEQAIQAVRRQAGLSKLFTPEGLLAVGEFSLKEGAKAVDLRDTDDVVKKAQTIGSTTLADALSEVDLKSIGGVLAKHYDQIAEKISKAVGSTPVHVLSDAEYKKSGFHPYTNPAYYDPLTHAIYMSESIYRGPNLAKNLFHESIHAATSRKIVLSERAKGDIRAIMDEALSKNRDYADQYGFTNEHEFLAEALSDAQFQGMLGRTKISKELAEKLGLKEWRNVTVWKGIVEWIRNIFGISKDASSALEAALRATEKLTRSQPTERGVGLFKEQLEGLERHAAKAPEKPGKQLELDVTRQEDKAIFKPGAMGTTVQMSKLYNELIKRQNEEDMAYVRGKAQEAERKRQTKEWNDAKADMRPKVVDDVNARPDIAADAAFRSGMRRLDKDSLTEEQLATFPERYLSWAGEHPDDVAPFFNYPSGADMIAAIAEFNAGLGKQRYDTFKRQLINAELDRRLEAKFGDLQENIIREAEEHVLGVTQMDMLHEETLASAAEAGHEFPFSKDDTKAWAKAEFDRAINSKVSAEKYLTLAGKAGRGVELSLLKGDALEAYKFKQFQYKTMLLAREAKAFEKEQARFEKLEDKYTKRSVPRVDQVYVDFIQDLLLSAGVAGRRNLGEIQQALARSPFSSLDHLVTSSRGDGWEPAVPDYIVNKTMKPLKDMPVEEWREFHAAITSLDHIGKGVRTINIAGEAHDYATWKAGVIATIETLPKRDKNNPLRIAFRFDATMVRMEEVIKDLDLREEHGPLFAALIRPMAEAKHTEYSLQEDLAKALIQIKGDFGRTWMKSLKDTIPQNFFHDFDGQLFDLTREHMIGIMLNWGNRSNIEKFTKGWGKDRAAELEANIKAMFDQHARPEDWAFAQAMWDVWKPWRDMADSLYYDISGVPPKWIEAHPIDTPHGTFEGGYWPIIYDKFRSKIDTVADRTSPNALLGPNYQRATPGNHYTVERTGYTDYVQFQKTIEVAAARMQQMIHDIAYRKAVIEAHKIIKDPEIIAAIKQHYGLEYSDQLKPWLKDIANHFNMDEVPLNLINSLLQQTRFRLMSHALGLNLKVIGSPDVGKWNPVVDAAYMANKAEWKEIAYSKSREIPHTFKNMDRDYRERLENLITKRGIKGATAEAVRLGFAPVVAVSQRFRIQTFVSEYRKAIDKGFPEGEAVAIADSYVRERHGSAGLPDLPAIMRGNEAMKAYTMFYGYFNTMYNWQRQMPQALRTGNYKKFFEALYGSVLVGSFFGAALFNQAKEDDSWPKIIGKALVLQPLSTMVFARDLANTFIEGFQPRTPLGNLFQAYSSLKTDIDRAYEGKPLKKPIQHVANVVGLTTGLPLAQIGRSAQFIHDAATGEQRPRNILEWIRGIIHGEAELKKSR